MELQYGLYVDSAISMGRIVWVVSSEWVYIALGKTDVQINILVSTGPLLTPLDACFP